MGLQVKKTIVGALVAIWQFVLETAVGGFALDTTGLTDGTVLLPGTPMGFDEITRKARVVKTAELYENAGASDVAYKVKKGHLFKVGEYLAAVLAGKAYAITAINTSEAEYDTLTVGTTLGVALTAGVGLFQSSATGASAAAYIVTPKGLLYDRVVSEASATLSVVIRGTVYARRAPKVPDAMRSALPLIVFSESY